MRYKVLAPIAEGFSYWRVVDTHLAMNNKMAEIHKSVPCAEMIIRSMCDMLNNLGCFTFTCVAYPAEEKKNKRRIREDNTKRRDG